MKTICVFNQKGGVGKTTTNINICSYLAMQGFKVLAIDIDPQGNTTSGLGIDKRKLDKSIYDLLTAGEEIETIIMKSELVENLYVVPATMELAGAEVEIIDRKDREYILKNEINKISSFVGKENKVTNEIIDQLSQKKVENDIFKLIDYIGQKNSSDAMKILNDMLYEGESVFGIFSMIARQFKVIMQVRQLQIQGHSSKGIAERLKLHPFVVGKALKQTKNFSDEIIIDILNSILESDFKIKNGLVRDTLSIEMLISKYCKKGN